MTKYLEELFAELEAEGDIVRNGKFRRNRKGELEPVYVMTEKGERKAEEEKRQRRLQGPPLPNDEERTMSDEPKQLPDAVV